MPSQIQSNYQSFSSTPKFAGGTVVSYEITAGWADASTYLNLEIVNDEVNGDDFLFQDGVASWDDGTYIGQPFQFTYGGFTWGGILKSCDQSKDFSGNPVYHATLISPVEVLDAAQVILSQYVGPNNDSIFGGIKNTNGASFQVSNLLNVYGWAEGGGQNFGRSLETSIGLPWTGEYGISNALVTLTNTPPAGATTTNYGSYITYKQNYYKLDLSNLPVPPSYYRLGGVVNMTLRDLISKFFEDAGSDWIIKLTVNPNAQHGPHTISFIAVPRYIQQPLGKILSYITGQDQTVIESSSHGQELRSDITQAFLVGGAAQYLQPITNNGINFTIIPFFGFDYNGNPITGLTPEGTYNADDNLNMNLNATSIADIAGELGLGLSYPCTILELRCALGNYDTWAAYLQIYKPQLAQQLQIHGMWDTSGLAQAQTIVDLMNDDPAFASQLADMFNSNHWPAVAQRLYEFVRNQAETYYGKKFIVLLPFDIQVKIDNQTGQITLSNDISDAGYAPEGSNLLNLSYINENFFMDDTGRFYPFVSFLFANTFNSVASSKTVIPNVSYLDNVNCVIQYGANPNFSYVFSRCEQGADAPTYQNGFIAGGAQIFYMQTLTGLSQPAMVITVPDAIWAQAEDITGSITDLAAMLQMDVGTLQTLVDFRSTSFGMVIHPPAIYPNGCAVALKSNQVLYGPWGQYQRDGKLYFEQDDGLVPWEYGGYTLMTEAAIAKLNNIAKGNQVLERGEFVEAGIPQLSIGDQLISEGPLVTAIKTNVSTQKVETVYTMETFVNRAGVFTIENAEILRRIGKVYQQLRRTMRQTIINQIQRTTTMLSNYNGFMYGTSYAVEQHTPHAVLQATLYPNNSGTYTPFAFAETYQESLANLAIANSGKLNATACVGMEAMYRPYTMDGNSTSLTPFMYPQPSIGQSGVINATGLNPLQPGCDINWLLSGNQYTSMRTSKGQTDFNNARSVALKGPPVICGWGYDLQGNPTPNSGAAFVNELGKIVPEPWGGLQSYNNEFFPNYLQNSLYWPVGPLDIAWDKFRGVWAGRGMVLCGKAVYDIAPGATGYMYVEAGDTITADTLRVVNYLTGSSATIKGGTRMGCTYDPLNNKWRPTFADCS